MKLISFSIWFGCLMIVLLVFGCVQRPGGQATATSPIIINSLITGTTFSGGVQKVSFVVKENFSANQYQLLDNGNIVQTIPGTGSFVFLWDVSKTPFGTLNHTLVVRGILGLNKSVDSAPVSVYVLAPPSLSGVSLLDNYSNTAYLGNSLSDSLDGDGIYLGKKVMVFVEGFGTDGSAKVSLRDASGATIELRIVHVGDDLNKLFVDSSGNYALKTRVTVNAIGFDGKQSFFTAIIYRYNVYWVLNPPSYGGQPDSYNIDRNSSDGTNSTLSGYGIGNGSYRDTSIVQHKTYYYGTKSNEYDKINGKAIQSSATPTSAFAVATLASEPQIVQEQVKCVFTNSISTQKCYTDNQLFACSGSGTCVADVSGEYGTKLTWTGSCGGFAYTVIDGINEYANFKC